MKMKATVVLLCLATLSGCQLGADSAGAQTPTQGEGLVLRRLWTGDGVAAVDFHIQSVSPDGRFITYVDWAHGELAVRDQVAGDDYLITDKRRDALADSTVVQQPFWSVFSRDGGRIAYVWQTGPAHQLRVIDFAVGSDGVPAGANSRVIFSFSQPETGAGYPLDWSPDGKTVLVLLFNLSQPTVTSTLSLIASDGSFTRALKTFDSGGVGVSGRGKFSVDGRYIAYDLPSDPESPDHDLFLLSVDGTQEVRLTSGPSHDRLLDWYGDGILFQSTRGGTPGVWHLPVEEGRPAGPAKLLRADTWGHRPIAVAGDAYYFGVVAERPTLYTAAVDLAVSRLTSTPTALEDPYGGSDIAWEWSPDGRSLAHIVDSQSGPQLVIRSRSGEEFRRIRLGLRGAANIRWADDGGAVFIFGSDLSGQRGIHRVEIESGRLETVLGFNELSFPAYHTLFDVSPDGSTIYLSISNIRVEENAPIYLIAFDLQSRRERRLAQVGALGRVARSPSGSQLAFVTPDPEGVRHVAIMTVDSGHLEPVFDLSPRPGLQDDVGVRSLDWTPDGESLIVSLHQGGSRVDLWQIPVDGGDPRRIEGIEGLFWSSTVRLSRDGRQLAFRAGGNRGEIWVMENIMEAVPAGSRGSR